MSVATTNALVRGGALTLGDLQLLTEHKLRTKNFTPIGVTRLGEIKQFLGQHGTRLRAEEETLLERAKAVYGEAHLSHVSLVHFRELLGHSSMLYSLRIREIVTIGDLARVSREGIEALRNHPFSDDEFARLKEKMQRFGVRM